MSYIIFDYQCSNCDNIAGNLFVRRSQMDNVECDQCGALMKRLPAAPTTTFKFHDRSALKGKKAVSLMDPNHTGADTKKWARDLD